MSVTIASQNIFSTSEVRSAPLWLPERVLFTPAALEKPWGQQILARVQKFGLAIEKLRQNRLSGIKGKNERETYHLAKRTLAVVTAPASGFKLSPVPPSADWQFHIASGCPGHCQYCYLAGSLSGPPVIRVYANLPEIIANLSAYENPDRATTFEASCYTDPLGIEHLSGSLAECIRYFGTRSNGHLRFVSKFDRVDELLDIPHNGHTRCRISLNAATITDRFEGGTASIAARLLGLRKLGMPKSKGGGGYPVGLVIAPIMVFEDWQLHYRDLFDRIEAALDFDCDLTFELITHRFTPKAKEVLQTWYPQTKLNLDETERSSKYNKFGGIKYVYENKNMKELREFFEREIERRFPKARIDYWT